MGATPVCVVTAAGIQRPDFNTVLSYVVAAYRALYGEDVYLGADSQDGQFLSLLANAIHDANGETVAVYNAYSPSTALGAGLSSVVKINGIRRKSATYSTCDFVIVGQVGAAIVGGSLSDDAGYTWALPDFNIPPAGQILVTGVCQTLGAITLVAGAIDTANGKGRIATPQLGWQAASNSTAATAGQPVETDSQLRQRQSISAGLPSQTVLEGMLGALFALPGVTRIRAYENDTNEVDANTAAPGHTLSLVIDGGVSTDIAAVIAAKKSPGVGTYGDVLVPRTDAYGVSHPIRFFRPVALPVAWNITVRPKAGYTLDVAAAIQASLAAYTNSIPIGGNQEFAGAYPAANLTGDPRSSTFEVVELSAYRRDGSVDSYGDLQAKFNESPVCLASDVTVTALTA